MPLTSEQEKTMADAHRAKYEELAQRLGVEALKALVPFTREQITHALAQGDVHLNSLPLPAWDSRHGYHKDDNAGRGFHTASGKRIGADAKPCPCCGTPRVAPDLTAGVWGLVRAAVKRDHTAMAWSLSDTVSLLKHVARYHIAGDA